jgi:cytidylate kinase
MAYDLIDYFNRRYAVDLKKEPEHFRKKPGPFITISRETGCGANEVARALVDFLKKQHSVKWKLINKEIIYQAAHRLQVDPKRVYEVIESEERTVVHEIIDALATRYYKNDRVVRKNVADILKFDARQGFVVIVGRGGVAVTKEIPNGLHIKLVAPLEWRVQQIRERKKMDRKEAERYIMESDQKRIHLLEQLSGKPVEQLFFDLIVNRERFSVDQTVRLLYQTMEIKKII